MGWCIMDAIDILRERLQKYPDIHYEIKGYGIQIPALTPDNFSVSLGRSSVGYTVSFEGWHEEFTSASEAVKCLLFGLSEKCRLKVLRRGWLDHKWVVQERRDGEWRDFSTVGLLLFPFWLRAHERYLQNDFIQESKPDALEREPADEKDP